MKRMLMALAVVGIASAASRADWGGPAAPPSPQGQSNGPTMPQIGGPNTLMGMGAPASAGAPDQYGLHPRLKRMFRLNSPRETGQVPPSYYYPMMGYNQNGPAYNPTGYPAGAYGPAQGTLVFPHNPYVRSPRDYFMLDVNR
jgi:hypothetical protein